MKMSDKIRGSLLVLVVAVFVVTGCGATGFGGPHSMRSTVPEDVVTVVNTANKNRMMEKGNELPSMQDETSPDISAATDGAKPGHDTAMMADKKPGAMQAESVAVAHPSAMKPDVRQHANAEIICEQYGASQHRYYLKSSDGGKKLVRIRVGASGYGAPPKNYYPVGQRRLMTMRAAKVDAYRALAEIVGGLHVWGGTAIADMVLERDRYRTFVDTYVRGARVIDVTPMDDDTYKTTVEMTIDQGFLSQVMAFVDPGIGRLCNSGDSATSADNESDNANGNGNGKDSGNGKGSYVYYGVNNVSPTFYYSE